MDTTILGYKLYSEIDRKCVLEMRLPFMVKKEVNLAKKITRLQMSGTVGVWNHPQDESWRGPWNEETNQEDIHETQFFWWQGTSIIFTMTGAIHVLPWKRNWISRYATWLLFNWLIIGPTRRQVTLDLIWCGTQNLIRYTNVIQLMENSNPFAACYFDIHFRKSVKQIYG